MYGFESQVSKFRFGSVCNEESLKLSEKGNHMIKAVLSEDNTSNGMKEKKLKERAKARRPVSCHKSLGEGGQAQTKGWRL